MALWNRITGAIVGLGIGGSIGRAVRPIFEVVEQEAWDENAYRILSMGQLAQLVAMGITDYEAAAAQARRDGFDGNKFRAMVEFYLSPPQYGYAYEALRRGTIDESQFRHMLEKQGIEPQYHEALVELRHVLPSVTDMVRFGVREVYNPPLREALDLDAEFPTAFATQAERIGLEETTARDYWAAHWELPSYTQGTEMLFRGEIDPEQFGRLLKALDYAPTWRKPLEAIARRIPTITDMIRFAVREVYNPPLREDLGIDAEYPTAFTAQAALHGMSEKHAREYWAAHWRLPSARQGYQMLWRKEIEPDDLDNLLKALDYPPMWRDRLANIAHIVPGRIDLKRLLRHGIYTREQVKDGYVAIGYDEQHAEWMTQVAEAEMPAGTSESTWVGKARSQLWTRLHTETVAQQLTPDAVADGFNALGIPETERGPILTLWALESLLRRRELTETEIRKAYKKSTITEAEALAELRERGMSDEDADTYLQSG